MTRSNGEVSLEGGGGRVGTTRDGARNVVSDPESTGTARGTRAGDVMVVVSVVITIDSSFLTTDFLDAAVVISGVTGAEVAVAGAAVVDEGGGGSGWELAFLDFDLDGRAGGSC